MTLNKSDQMKNILLPLFCFFFLSNLSAQNAKVDSLHLLITSLPQDTILLKTYTELTTELNSIDINEAKKIGVRGIKLAKKLKQDNLSGYMQIALGRSYANNAQIDSAQHHFLTAKSYFDKTGSIKGQAAVIAKLMYVTRQRNQHHQTIKLALQAVKMYEKLGDYYEVSDAYMQISDADYGLDKYRESIVYAEKELKILEEHDLMHEASNALNGIAHTYAFLEEFDTALMYSDSAMAVVKPLNDDYKMASVLSVRANLLKNMGRFEESAAAYKVVLAHAEKIGSLGWQSHTLNKMGDLYNRAKQYPKALKYLLKCKVILEQLGENKYYGDHHSFIAAAYAGIGKLDSAYYYKGLENEYNIKVYTEESNLISAKLKTEFETEKKEATIAQQQTELLLKNTQQKYFMGIGGLLFLLAGSAFWAFRNK